MKKQESATTGTVHLQIALQASLDKQIITLLTWFYHSTNDVFKVKMLHESCHKRQRKLPGYMFEALAGDGGALPVLHCISVFDDDMTSQGTPVIQEGKISYLQNLFLIWPKIVFTICITIEKKISGNRVTRT